MSRATYFDQECPTCGRRLQVRVEYLGKKVVCRHCQGQFLAGDPEHGAEPLEAGLSGLALLNRAEELLAFTEGRHPSPPR